MKGGIVKGSMHLNKDFDRDSKSMSEERINEVMELLCSGRNKHLAVLKLLNGMEGDDSGDGSTDSNHHSNIFFYDGYCPVGRRKIRQRGRGIICCTVK